MSKLRNLMMLVGIISVLVLSGCDLQKSDDQAAMDDDMNHIGCQEGEINEDGECVVAEDNNAALFDKDFSGEVETEDVVEGELRGFVARPSVEGDYPGVVMIHEWWGLNDNVKYMAQLLASEGYNVFAIDLYGGEVAEDSAKAGELATSVRGDVDGAVAKMKLATDYLEEMGSDKLASLGWCFGGQQSLNLALNDELDATVIYYGSLVEDREQLKNIDWPVLGIFGSEDSSISVDSVDGFRMALNDLGIENDINIYDGVGHAFANPSGSNYAAEETIDAWNKTVNFLSQNLKGESADEPVAAEVEEEVEFDLTGENFAFRLYGVEAPILKVKKGQKVVVNLTSIDGFHDFVIDEFDAATEKINTGGETSVEFIASETGEFEYYCSVGSHRANGMRGKLIIE